MVPGDELSDLLGTWKHRNVKDTADILNEVNALDLKGDQEILLKGHSLRSVKVRRQIRSPLPCET